MIKLIDGCFLTSTTGPAELQEFAKRLGADKKWYTKGGAPHASGCYLLETEELRRKARSMGAKPDTYTFHTNSSRKRARQLRRLGF